MSAYTDLSTETLRSWLTEALQARQNLMINPTDASGPDGRRVSYQQRVSDMDTYINGLRSEISRREAAGSGANAGGPIVIGF